MDSYPCRRPKLASREPQLRLEGPTIFLVRRSKSRNHLTCFLGSMNPRGKSFRGWPSCASAGPQERDDARSPSRRCASPLAPHRSNSVRRKKTMVERGNDDDSLTVTPVGRGPDRRGEGTSHVGAAGHRAANRVARRTGRAAALPGRRVFLPLHVLHARAPLVRTRRVWTHRGGARRAPSSLAARGTGGGDAHADRGLPARAPPHSGQSRHCPGRREP
jgi:hypothetical protein